MRYIDFDGVILDDEDLLFYEWRKNPNRHELPESEKIKYVQNCNWPKILRESVDINDALYILRNSDPEYATILTKIHSMENEGKAKIEFLREQGIKQSIVLVPYYFKKSEVVTPKGNILIDDCLRNLKEWYDAGGYPMFFDKKEDNIDSWGKYNQDGYQRVRKIDEGIK